MDFFELLDSAQPYLLCFDYDHYPGCFAQFQAGADGFFASLDPGRLDAAAEEILRRAEERWRAAGFWHRSELMRKDRTVLALFLSPAAARHSDTARAFADVLEERWNARFPKNRFHAGDYDKIMLGFDKDFMGIKLRKSKDRG